MDSRSQSLPTHLPAYTSGSLSGSKRKRSSSPEAEDIKAACPSKQLKTAHISPLSEANLRELEAQTSVSGTTSKKRPSSRLSTLRSDADSTQTSVSIANYRFRHLAAAEIRLKIDPPDHIKAAIDAILEHESTMDRRKELEEIAREFHLESKKRVIASDGEDDFVALIIQVLKQVKDDKISFHQKANWREDLKPRPPRPSVNTSFVMHPPVVDSPPHSPSRKRQVRPTDEPRSLTSDTTINPPQVSDVQSPAVVSTVVKKELSIKTPRPDVTIGIDIMEFKASLASFAPKFTERKFNELLSTLEDMKKPTGPTEPLLVSVPASRASDLTFPFAVVEGKSHSTGKTIFEAQNQAAVSGACALKIQLDLDSLTKQASAASDASDSAPQGPPLLFFSVCTEGPYHELWAHYTIEKDGVSSFNSSLQSTCHGTLLTGVKEFIVAFDNVCHWGTGEFMQSVVESLRVVASVALED